MRRLSYNAVSGIVISCLTLGYLASFFFVRRLRPGEFKKEFAAINLVYEKGDYRRAIVAYESLASRYRMQCMSLYYNLANAYYKTNVLGKAILYYKKAQRLAPRDRDVAANLRVAETEAGVAGRPGPKSPERTVGRRMLKLFSLFEGVAASLTFRWALVICVVLAVFFSEKRRYFVRISVILAVLLYLSVGATIYKAHVQKSYRLGVVLDESSSVRKKPGESGPTTRVLREGTTVQLKRRQNGWCEIVMYDGEKGWVKEQDIGEI